MTQYRYLFADLLTNSVIGELPLTGVNFTQQLNSIGSLQGRLLLSGVDAYAMNVAASTVPTRTAVYVDRDGVIVWGGILWSRPYSSKTQTMTFHAQEFESYFQHRMITTTATFTAQDQMNVARSLITTAQSATNGDIGVLMGSETSGVTVTRTFYGYELKNVYQALLDLSRSDSGFDFRIKAAYSGTSITKTLMLGYPMLGDVYSTSQSTAPVFSFPSGNIVEYDLDENGANCVNSLYVVGAGSNEGKIIVSSTDATKLGAGWPLLQGSANYADFTDSTLLTNLAVGQVGQVSYPPISLKITVPAYVDPILGSYDIGDECRVIIQDDRFPTGLDSVYRIVALNVSPGESGPERVTITLGTVA